MGGICVVQRYIVSYIIRLHPRAVEERYFVCLLEGSSYRTNAYQVLSGASTKGCLVI
jgi:hypothetical protein